MFWEIFYDLCVKQNTKPLQVVKELSIASGAITSWKNGSIPNGANLKKLADYFGVTVDFLMGNKAKSESEQYEENVITYCKNGKVVKKQLSSEQMDMLITMIEALR